MRSSLTRDASSPAAALASSAHASANVEASRKARRGAPGTAGSSVAMTPRDGLRRAADDVEPELAAPGGTERHCAGEEGAEPRARDVGRPVLRCGEEGRERVGRESAVTRSAMQTCARHCRNEIAERREPPHSNSWTRSRGSSIANAARGSRARRLAAAVRVRPRGETASSREVNRENPALLRLPRNCSGVAAARSIQLEPTRVRENRRDDPSGQVTSIIGR